MNKLTRDELIRALHSWVLGQVLESVMNPNGYYNGSFRTLGADGVVRVDVDAVHGFADIVHNKVWKYLEGRAVLDSHYSDFEVVMASTAKRIFSVHFPKSNYDLVIIATALGLQTRQVRELAVDSKLESAAEVGEFIRAQPASLRG